MIEYPEVIHIVYVPAEKITGTVSNMGVYASIVNYTIDDVEYEELMNNEDFIVVNEITLMHFEEEDNG